MLCPTNFGSFVPQADITRLVPLRLWIGIQPERKA